ncbi:MAG: hypothetical protein RIS35_1849 [Pseudomonadota bacterium]|jgi:hypothetical protein
MAIVILRDVRLSYPDLWKPGKPMNPTDTPKYGAQLIFSPDSDAAKVAKETFIAVAQEVFGANWQNVVAAMEKSKKCLRKGDENLTKDGAIRDGYAGNQYVVARNKAKPLVIGPRKGPDGQFPILTENDGKPYGGCFVNAKVDIKAMKGFEKVPSQVYATLLTIQFVRDGQAFGAAPGTAEGFDDVVGADAPAGDDGLF